MEHRMRLFISTPLLIVLVLLFSAAFSWAATRHTVMNTNDSGEGSLRYTIANAASGDIIEFSLPPSSTIPLSDDQLVIDKDLSIIGPGAEDLVILGPGAETPTSADNNRVFNVSDCTLTVSDLTVSDGDPTSNAMPPRNGGGFLITDANVTLHKVNVSNNKDQAYLTGSLRQGGAGICHIGGGSLSLFECKVEHNQGQPGNAGAGGIYCEAPLHMEDTSVSLNEGYTGGLFHGKDGADISSTINRCLFSQNTGKTVGGMQFETGNQYSTGSVTVLLENCTICSNIAPGSTPSSGWFNYGGGIQAEYNSILNIVNSSIVNNISDAYGGGIYAIRNSVVNLKNSILANNNAVYRNGDNWVTQSGNIISQGYNIIGPADGSENISTGTDRYAYYLSMGPLEDNGGPTMTMSLPYGSPAIDFIPLSQGYPDTDQRGIPRIVGNADVGPFEFLSIPDKPVILSPLEGATGVALEAPLSADAYSHPASVEHVSTLWQISTSETSFDEELLWELSSNYFLTSATVAPNVLEESCDYFLRLRFTDGDAEESFWSDIISFKTMELPEENAFYDGNGNGIPDGQEVVVSLDLDGNEVDDNNQEGMKPLESGNGYGAVSVLAGENVDSINSIKLLDPVFDIDDDRNMPEDLPMGVLSFNLSVPEGSEATITVFFESPLPDDAVWYKHGSEGWYDYSDHAVFAADMSSVELTFQDGGFGDADGLVNGTIVDPSGPVFTSESSSGGGGCHIGGNALSSMLTLIPLVFLAIRKK